MRTNVFALSLLVWILLSFLILLRWGQRGTDRDMLGGLLLAAGSFLLLRLPLSGQLTLRGGSLLPLGLGCILAGVAVYVLPWRLEKWGAAVVLAALGFGLSWWGLELADHKEWVGNASWPEHREQVATMRLRDFKEALATLAREHPEQRLDPGWLTDVCRAAFGEEMFARPLACPSVSVSRVWHTGFTGLFRLEERAQDIWCPGGAIGECVDALSWRER